MLWIVVLLVAAMIEAPTLRDGACSLGGVTVAIIIKEH
jgi:hypothetical protein